MEAAIAADHARATDKAVGGLHDSAQARLPQPLSLREGVSLVKTYPWHSTKTSVHHNDTDCTEGNNIEPENRRTGTGGKRLCDNCARLPRSSTTNPFYRSW